MNLSHFLMAALIAGITTLSACKKDPEDSARKECDDIWIEGITYWDASSGEAVALCEPVGPYNYVEATNPSPGASTYQFTTSCTAPKVNVNIFGTDRPFQAGDVFTETDDLIQSLQQQGYNEVYMRFEAVPKQGTTLQTSELVSCRFEFDAIDYSAKVFSGTLAFTYLEAHTGTQLSREVRLEEVVFN